MLSRQHVNHTRICMSLPDSDSVSIMEEKFDEKKALKEIKSFTKEAKKVF